MQSSMLAWSSPVLHNVSAQCRDRRSDRTLTGSGVDRDVKLFIHTYYRDLTTTSSGNKHQW
jgi:hypothetical protein